jgi:hypothetical protein
MKNTFLLLALPLALLACSKDSDNPGTTTPGSTTPVFRFTTNGKSFQWNYSYQQTANKSVGLVKNSAGEYSLSALSDGEYLKLGIPTRLLLEKSYTYTQGTTTTGSGATEAKLTDVDPANTYGAANTGDAVTVEITQLNNSKASGTFQAQLSVPGTPSKKLQINGAFANIEVLE